MAIAFALLPDNLPNPRHFAPRVTLEMISDDELTNSRLPRDMVQEIVEEFAVSDFGNLTERGRATPPDTKVGEMWNILIYIQ